MPELAIVKPYCPKRICMVSHSYYESDNRIMRYAEALAERGDSVEVIALRRSPEQPASERLNGVILHRIQDRFGRKDSGPLAYLSPLLRFFAASAKWLFARDRTQKFDLIHVHNIPDFLVFAAWPAKARGARLILDIHDIVPEFFASKFGASPQSLFVRSLKWVEKASARVSDHVILANDLWLERYAARSAHAEKCSVFINYVDQRIFRPPAHKRKSERPLIIYPGGLQWHQGLDIAIRAFASLKSRIPDAEFHIYGDGAKKSELIALVDDLGLNGSVRFFDPLSLREIADVVATADLGVTAKRADSFGNEAYSTKIMEFMSLGVPVVVSRTRVDQHYFDDGVVCFFESGDVEAFADAMYSVLTDQGLRETLIRNASEYAARESWDRHKNRYLELVDRLIADRRNEKGIRLSMGAVDPLCASDPEIVPLLEGSLDRLERWVRAHGYRAYDPGDGQMSYLSSLTFGVQNLERVLTAAVLRSPFNIRPLLGIKPHTSSKGMGYMAWGYLRRYRTTGDDAFAQKARMCLDWLLEHRSPHYGDLCWGNDFTFTTRAGRIPRAEPTIVWSGLIGQAFVEAFEVLGERRYLEAANSVCDWIIKLPREQTSSGCCLSYVAFDQVSIHNSNMLGAALLARVGAIYGRDDAIDLAREAMLYSCSRQNSDGSWFYGEAPKYHWIDSFHTGYNLDSLRRFIGSVPNDAFSSALMRGYSYFKENFFEADGRVKYMHDRLLPIDIQCCAQAIDTLAFFSDDDEAALMLAERTARWTVTHMQAPDGHFYYRDLDWITIRTPMFHWGQATMFKALAHLEGKLNSQAPTFLKSHRGAEQ